MHPSISANAAKIFISIPSGLMLLIALLAATCSCDRKQIDTSVQIVLIEVQNFMYLAKVTKPYTDTDAEVHVYIFNAEIREDIGDRVSRDRIATTRVKPPDGWGTHLFAIQYLWEKDWIYTEQAAEFADHYLVTLPHEQRRKVPLSDVRFPIPRAR